MDLAFLWVVYDGSTLLGLSLAPLWPKVKVFLPRRLDQTLFIIGVWWNEPAKVHQRPLTSCGMLRWPLMG